MTRDEEIAVIVAAAVERREWVSEAVAGLVGCSVAEGSRLEPFDLADAAILARAERLFVERLEPFEALAAARAERPAWGREGER